MTALTEQKHQLCAKLQKAVELELCTLPPYLTALWSIKPNTNVQAAVVIRSVLMEEMLHLTLAANVLSAVGGKPRLGKDNIPQYPLRLEFQGKKFKDRELDLHIAPFSKDAVLSFMQIELPDNFAAAPRTLAKPELDVSGYTIGDFYRGIQHDITELCNAHGERAVFSGDPKHQVSEEDDWRGGGRPLTVHDRASAIRALSVIAVQGEGSDGTLFDGDKHFFGQPQEVAHYFRFKQIYCERYYQPADHIHSEPSGAKLPVNYADVYPVKIDARSADYEADPELKALNTRFNRGYSLMLTQLMEGFGGNPAVFYTATMNGMRGLTSVAEAMVKLPIPGDREGRTGLPSFEWQSPALETLE